MEILGDRRKEKKIIYNDILNTRVETIMHDIIKSCVKNCKIDEQNKVYEDKSQFVRSALIYYLENFVKQRYPEGIENIPKIEREKNTRIPGINIG